MQDLSARNAVDGPETPPESLPARLRRDIMTGALAEGSRLKTQELARRYETSVNPVREALHQLSGEGFVILSRNRGATVRRIDESFVRNIFDIRALIEPYLIRLFVGHATERDLAEMEAIQTEIEALENHQQQRLRALDEAFHAITYRDHYNDEARAIRERHGQVIQVLGGRYPASTARRTAQNREHREIVAAIRAADADLASQIVERHARGAERHLLEQMRRRTTPARRAAE